MSTKPKELDLTIRINLEGIIGFNSNLGENGPWGSYNEPFHSHQFVTPPEEGKGKPAALDGIPDFPARTKIRLVVRPANEDLIQKYDYCVEYIRLILIGPTEFTHSTPRDLWAEILNLKQTKGAIGADGDFFLAQTDNDDNFELLTSDDLNSLSYNLMYEVCFSFKLNGYTKYCIIDPLIKTSSGHT